jgi:hypothetical protein
MMTEVKVTAANFIEQIRTHFPEVEESYRKQVDELEGADGMPSNYLFTAYVFKPRFVQEMEEGKMTAFLKRFATFIERVCVDNDPEAVNVIWIKFFEWLIFRPKELEMMWPWLGAATRTNIRDAARRWSKAGQYHGRTENLPESNIPK